MLVLLGFLSEFRPRIICSAFDLGLGLCFVGLALLQHKLLLQLRLSSDLKTEIEYEKSCFGELIV